jgi:hypothetical protein
MLNNINNAKITSKNVNLKFIIISLSLWMFSMLKYFFISKAR